MVKKGLLEIRFVACLAIPNNRRHQNLNDARPNDRNKDSVTIPQFIVPFTVRQATRKTYNRKKQLMKVKKSNGITKKNYYDVITENLYNYRIYKWSNFWHANFIEYGSWYIKCK